MAGSAINRKWLPAVGAAVLGLAVLTGAALASAPGATTGPTTAVGSTTATVSGTVRPGSEATTWYVEYGTSTSYGSKTPAKSAGSGSGPVDVSAALAGLQPGTTYHYRLDASNGAGTSHGTDAVFTTSVPPAATTGTASGIGATAATLNGTVDPNSRDTTFYFEYGTSTAYGAKTATRSAGSAATAQAESAGIAGLQSGRTYHFRIVASSDAGTSTGKDSSFTTSSAPTVVTSDASSVTPTSARLRGTVTPNGLSTKRWFEYGTTTSYGTKTSSAGVGSGTRATSVSATVKKLKAARTYHFRLVARNSSGTSFGADETFSTVGPPSAQTAAAQGVGPDVGVLTGSLDTRGRSTRWRFDYGTSGRYGKSTSWKSAGSKAGARTVSATRTGLTPSTTYHYRLVAKSDAGTAYGADVTFTTTGVTLSVLARQVVFGRRVRLSGVVPTHRAGEQVVIYAQSYGGGSFQARTTVLTGVDGTWAYLATPRIGTEYEARWRGGTSAPVAIGVHPKIALRQTSTRRFVVRVVGGRSFTRRLIQLQRRAHGRWSTIRRVRLGARSGADFRAFLPKGRSLVRIAFSVNQAGAGFLGGTSRAITVKR